MGRPERQDGMAQIRNIRRVVTGSNQIDGAGVRLVRVIGRGDVEDFDPFLMLDSFDSRNPEDYVRGFPWHPHRGIETVTYLIAGDVEHGDSLGNGGHIRDGGCQWMTAGGGILHQEMPQAAPIVSARFHSRRLMALTTAACTCWRWRRRTSSSTVMVPARTFSAC